MSVLAMTINHKATDQEIGGSEEHESLLNCCDSQLHNLIQQPHSVTLYQEWLLGFELGEHLFF